MPGSGELLIEVAKGDRLPGVKLTAKECLKDHAGVASQTDIVQTLAMPIRKVPDSSY